MSLSSSSRLDRALTMDCGAQHSPLVELAGKLTSRRVKLATYLHKESREDVSMLRVSESPVIRMVDIRTLSPLVRVVVVDNKRRGSRLRAMLVSRQSQVHTEAPKRIISACSAHLKDCRSSSLADFRMMVLIRSCSTPFMDNCLIRMSCHRKGCRSWQQVQLGDDKSAQRQRDRRQGRPSLRCDSSQSPQIQ